MKKLLLSLLASFVLPSAVNAESIWLVIQAGYFNGTSLVKIEMEDISQCELMGAKWLSTEKVGLHRNARGYECFKGK